VLQGWLPHSSPSLEVPTEFAIVKQGSQCGLSATFLAPRPNAAVGRDFLRSELVVEPRCRRGRAVARKWETDDASLKRQDSKGRTIALASCVMRLFRRLRWPRGMRVVSLGGQQVCCPLALPRCARMNGFVCRCGMIRDRWMWVGHAGICRSEAAVPRRGQPNQVLFDVSSVPDSG
jgi:hypothetical protein